MRVYAIRKVTRFNRVGLGDHTAWLNFQTEAEREDYFRGYLETDEVSGTARYRCELVSRTHGKAVMREYFEHLEGDIWKAHLTAEKTMEYEEYETGTMPDFITEKRPC